MKDTIDLRNYISAPCITSESSDADVQREDMLRAWDAMREQIAGGLVISFAAVLIEECPGQSGVDFTLEYHGPADTANTEIMQDAIIQLADVIGTPPDDDSSVPEPGVLRTN